jgi:prophage regulatory protein
VIGGSRFILSLSILQKENMAHPKIYRLPAVLEATGLCSSSAYDLISRGLFPKQFKLGGPGNLGGPGSRAVGWDSAAVDSWIADRIASGSGLNPGEQDELSALLARFPELGAEPDTSGMEVHELRGLLRFLQRRASKEVVMSHEVLRTSQSGSR